MMISRRQFVLATASSFLSGRAFAISGNNVNWSTFHAQMTALAEAEARQQVTQKEVAELGVQYLKNLDINSAEFKTAIADAYESGNRYWLWQRMIKEQNINGGILNIDSHQLVTLHDHPGATGVIRIISGETEVWQFDEVASMNAEAGATQLQRVSHSVLKVGDMAVLNPHKGNIHALRAMNGECRMLDFFIPPYQSSQRNWYEPLEANWFNEEKIACRKIPQHAFTDA